MEGLFSHTIWFTDLPCSYPFCTCYTPLSRTTFSPHFCCWLVPLHLVYLGLVTYSRKHSWKASFKGSGVCSLSVLLRTSHLSLCLPAWCFVGCDLVRVGILSPICSYNPRTLHAECTWQVDDGQITSEGYSDSMWHLRHSSLPWPVTGANVNKLWQSRKFTHSVLDEPWSSKITGLYGKLEWAPA